MEIKSKKVLVGISGGIDSAATTFLLKEQGYEVEALYIDMLGCEVALQNVINLTHKLGVKLHIAHSKEKFENRVISKVLAEHQAGRTPSPCTICNPLLKWKTLTDWADRLGIYWVATGHYIQIEDIGGWHYVKQGTDPVKDQSYYLCTLDQLTLSRAITPLGAMFKQDVREYLKNVGFNELASGGESQGVCFAKSGYGEFLRSNLKPKQGAVVNSSGEIIGNHFGYQLYTIGQKRGFIVHQEYIDKLRALNPNPKALEVRAINPLENSIEVGYALFSDTITINNAWFKPIENSSEGITIKIRGLGQNPTSEVDIEVLNDEKLKISLKNSSEKFWAATPGQPAVLYCGGLVVGAGIYLN